MSLINDALQRAKAAQQNTPPPASPLQFRPEEPQPGQRKGPGLVIPATLMTILVAGIFSWWLFGRQRDTVAARTPTPEPPPAAPAPPAAPVEVAPPTPAPSAPAVVAAPEVVTNSPAPVEIAKPAPPRLQALIYNPTRPSAIISGKTVFVGDRVREFRVVRIDATTATLVSATETNVLSLE